MSDSDEIDLGVTAKGGYVRAEIRALAERGTPISKAEWEALRLNRQEQELVLRYLDDEAIGALADVVFARCADDRARSRVSYSDFAVGLLGPELLRRIRTMDEAARAASRRLDDLIARLGPSEITTDLDPDVMQAIVGFDDETGPDEDPSTIDGSEEIRALIACRPREAKIDAPIDVVVHCPRCGMQHVDAPDPESGWTNPPHRSHLCAACGLVWRPADVCTNGVLRTQTSGDKDTPALPVVVVLRPGPRTSFRDRYEVYEMDPPGSGGLLLVYGSHDCNVVNGSWELVIDGDGRARSRRGDIEAKLIGYVEDQDPHITAFGGGDKVVPYGVVPWYQELLEAFRNETTRRAAT